MRWRQRIHTARPRRPKVRRLEANEQQQVLAEIANAVQLSPVLRAFCVEARVLRGRFYLHWRWRPADEACSEVWGRITPLEEPKDDLLLEVEYHYFGLPICVIAQPAAWYSRHRTPHIVECSEDRTRVLVRFIASSWSGETFGGTCLYLKQEGAWKAYTIRPNQSDNIAAAERWLIRRRWRPWCNEYEIISRGRRRRHAKQKESYRETIGNYRIRGLGGVPG